MPAGPDLLPLLDFAFFERPDASWFRLAGQAPQWLQSFPLETRTPCPADALVEQWNHLASTYAEQGAVFLGIGGYDTREAFDGWLPDELLWREKAEFGDGSGARDVLSVAIEAGISDAEMGKGSPRRAANGSLREPGGGVRPKAEAKKQYSFTFAADGIEAELARQPGDLAGRGEGAPVWDEGLN